ncbi:MAG: hypothetical protein ABIG94_12490 [Pseudomonadota bacterium]
MKILGYGEDALTLWAIKNRLPQILDDPSHLPECKIFYRPSFGRRGGPSSSQFGEFDFIILTKTCIYLGESKWDRSPELSNAGSVELRPEQVLRHRVFAFYVREWAFGQYDSWDKFLDGQKKFAREEINKPLAPTDSHLASNLRTVLGIIRRHFLKEPQIINLLLYFYDGSKGKPPNKTVSEFRLVPVDYSGFAEGNFIPIEI